MSRADIERTFERAAKEPTDMQGHMQVIREYSRQCRSAVEFGVYDCTSTWALLAGFPERLTSYDIIRRSEVDEVERAAEGSGSSFKFVLGDTAKVEIEETELLFIDSMHTYDHLRTEFSLHASKVRRFILLHDTTTFGDVDQCGQRPGLWQAIEEFLIAHPEWKLKERYTHCHGLTVLARA